MQGWPAWLVLLFLVACYGWIPALVLTFVATLLWLFAGWSFLWVVICALVTLVLTIIRADA